MRYTPIEAELFINNRKKLAKRITKNNIAIFNSNDVMPTNADGVMGFKQNSDLFYLCGIDQEETLLFLAPFHPDENLREVLFLRETNEHIAIWEGEKLTKEKATKLSGITTIFWTTQLEEMLPLLMEGAENILLNQNEHTRADSPVQTRDERFKIWFKEHFEHITIESIAPEMHFLRQVKSPLEIEQIQKACDITEKGFRRILNSMKPGKYEFEIEADITHEFLLNRSRGHAYQPIIAGGGNACVLHYISNNDQLKEGDLVLMDFGAEYGNYNADLTRCVPVSGKFSPRQKEVYEAVLDTLKYATSLLVPGNTYKKYTDDVCLFIEKKLIDLGLITQQDIDNQTPEKPAFRKYFMHGVSHSLGLDVHDVDNRERPFEEGMVFTVEPGIYIREENLGIRIENNVVITSGSPINLMANIPIEVSEIEKLMSK